MQVIWCATVARVRFRFTLLFCLGYTAKRFFPFFPFRMKPSLLLSLGCLSIAVVLAGCDLASQSPSPSPTPKATTLNFDDIPPPPSPPPLTPENIAWPEDMPQEVRDQLWKELEANQAISPAAEASPMASEPVEDASPAASPEATE